MVEQKTGIKWIKSLKVTQPGKNLTHEVESPIRSSSNRSSLGTHCKGIYLNRVQPRHSLPAYTEEYIVEEEECNRRRGDLALTLLRNRGIDAEA